MLLFFCRINNSERLNSIILWKKYLQTVFFVCLFCVQPGNFSINTPCKERENKKDKRKWEKKKTKSQGTGTKNRTRKKKNNTKRKAILEKDSRKKIKTSETEDKNRSPANARLHTKQISNYETQFDSQQNQQNLHSFLLTFPLPDSHLRSGC